jgi:hypothetical protein
MLRRGRMGQFRRGAEVRLAVRRPYSGDQIGAPRSLADRMKFGIRRLRQIFGSVARHGVAQHLRVHPSERSHERK